MLLILMTIACTAGDKGDTGAEDTGVADTDTVTVEGDAVRGGTLFTTSCTGCHGTDGTGGAGGAADLTVRVPAMSDVELAAQIENGSGTMPAQYSDAQDIADVIAHLRVTFP